MYYNTHECSNTLTTQVRYSGRLMKTMLLLYLTLQPFKISNFKYEKDVNCGPK